MDDNPCVSLVSSQVRGFPVGEAREGFQIYLEWLNSLLSNADIRQNLQALSFQEGRDWWGAA